MFSTESLHESPRIASLKRCQELPVRFQVLADGTGVRLMPIAVARTDVSQIDAGQKSDGIAAGGSKLPEDGRDFGG